MRHFHPGLLAFIELNFEDVEAFLAEANSDALLLPRIRALGDPDEEAALIFGAEDG